MDQEQLPEFIRYYLLLFFEYYEYFLKLYNDPQSAEIAKHVFFGLFVVGVIALPNFVCKVSDEDFEKFKEGYIDRKVKKMIDDEKVQKAQMDEDIKVRLRKQREEELKKQNDLIN